MFQATKMGQLPQPDASMHFVAMDVPCESQKKEGIHPTSSACPVKIKVSCGNSMGGYFNLFMI
jgi:hypothetical protein